jgi:multiple sugar transport system permease protein
MTRRRVALAVWLVTLAGPFLAAVTMSVCVGDVIGSHALTCSAATIYLNYVRVAFGGDGSSPLLKALTNSALLAGTVAIVSTAVALPVAAWLARRSTRSLWNAGAFAIGLRVVPVTAPLPVFAAFQEFLGAPNGWPIAVGMYCALFLPVASVLLAAGDWQTAHQSGVLLSLDERLSASESARLYFHALATDIFLAALGVFLLCWSDFVVAVSFLRPATPTVATVLANYQTFYGTQWGLLGTAVVLSIMPLAVASILGFLALRVRASGH